MCRRLLGGQWSVISHGNDRTLLLLLSYLPNAANWDTLLPGLSDTVDTTDVRCTTVEQLPPPPTEATNSQLTDPDSGLLASIKAKGAGVPAALRTGSPPSQRAPATAAAPAGSAWGRKHGWFLAPAAWGWPVWDCPQGRGRSCKGMMSVSLSSAQNRGAAASVAGIGTAVPRSSPGSPASPSVLCCRLPSQHLCSIHRQGSTVFEAPKKPGCRCVRLRENALSALPACEQGVPHHCARLSHVLRSANGHGCCRHLNPTLVPRAMPHILA